MSAAKITLKEFRAMVQRMSGDDEIQQRFFAQCAVLSSAVENHAFIIKTIKGLLEAGVGFAVLQQEGKIGIYGDEGTFGADLIPELWSDDRWHIGHEPWGGSGDGDEGRDE